MNYNKHNFIALLLAVLVFVLAFFVFVGNSQAFYGSSFGNSSSTYNTGFTTNFATSTFMLDSGDGYGIYLGQLSGTANGFRVEYFDDGADDRTYFQLYECPVPFDDLFDGGGNPVVNYCEKVVENLTFIILDSYELYRFDDGIFNPIPSFTFNPSKYYTVILGDNTSSAGTRSIKSSTVDIYDGFCYRNCGNSVDITFQLNATDIETEPILLNPVETPQYIEIIEPIYGTTTATNTVLFSVRFQTPPSIDFRPTTTRKYTVYDAITRDIEYVYSATVPPNSSENFIVNQNVTLSDGSKIIEAGYFTENGGLYSELDSVFFNVATNTWLANTGTLSPDDNAGNLSQIDCDLFDVGCQFQKAIMFLFYPSEGILDRFSNLWQTISTKVPFGYVTVTIASLRDFNQTGTPAFNLGNLPFQNEIFTPLRNGIGALLWLVYSVYFYRNRLVKLDI